MFNKIQNPETGNWVNIQGVVGRRVLRNYARQMGGAGRGSKLEKARAAADKLDRELAPQTDCAAGPYFTHARSVAQSNLELEEALAKWYQDNGARERSVKKKPKKKKEKKDQSQAVKAMRKRDAMGQKARKQHTERGNEALLRGERKLDEKREEEEEEEKREKEKREKEAEALLRWTRKEDEKRYAEAYEEKYGFGKLCLPPPILVREGSYRIDNESENARQKASDEKLRRAMLGQGACARQGL
jgi:hypothetical protein